MKLIAGIDEAGRGPLAGPVVAAAVILNPKKPIKGLMDSKKLTAKKREELSLIIQEQALAWGIGYADVGEIDQLNILQATFLAMERAVEALAIQPIHIQIDGNQLPRWNRSMEAIIGGDDKIPAISAASILAKVSRDQTMIVWDEHYPLYGFAKHKGYPTTEHVDVLMQLGPTPLHRRSYTPVFNACQLHNVD